MKKKADELLRFLEVDHLAERNMNEMSTGEARRILIARALVHDPEALILDEPTNSLDIHALYRFRETLRKIAQRGHSIILVTHAISDIIPEIQRVILIKKGAVVKDDRKEKLLTSDVLSAFFSIPLHVHHHNNFYSVF